jgi:hypothetical protein
MRGSRLRGRTDDTAQRTAEHNTIQPPHFFAILTEGVGATIIGVIGR